jgi:hypothetical protein
MRHDLLPQIVRRCADVQRGVVVAPQFSVREHAIGHFDSLSNGSGVSLAKYGVAGEGVIGVGRQRHPIGALDLLGVRTRLSLQDLIVVLFG